ncbi:bifunctional 2',3'-cyclic-nucleotide 2'-phosphodiesterase/3'-nucleotidase [Pseudidiomarina aestuarii]|uniref:bifunctional 2',3'-cyclic-nucleotide 2'-phosphodiesterase/3'-nucleotidase n=1 Tax=Pseudidiomarina aestuarii TaxID=624146 RepID=UPI003A98279D
MSATLGYTYLGVLSLVTMLASTSPATTPISATLRLIETSDVHGEVTGFDYFTGAVVQRGLVHSAATIRDAKAEQPNHILIDNGDLIQGSPLASWAQQHSPDQNPIIQVLNHLQFDVANIGNHEFNFGLDALWQTYAQADFAVISANIEALESASTRFPKWLRQTVVLDRTLQASDGSMQPIKIGFVGVVPPQIMMWDQQHLQGKIRSQDMVIATARGVAEVQEQGADVVVLVAHTGMPKNTALPTDAEQALHLIAQTPGIDAILFGHQHEVFPGTQVYDQLPNVDSVNGKIQGIAAVQPGVYGSHIGIIDLQLQHHDGEWQVLSSHSEARPISAAKAKDIEALVAAAHQQTLEYVKQPVGTTAIDLDHRYARIQPTASLQFIHEAQLWHLRQIQDPEIRQQLGTLPVVSAAAPFVTALSEGDTSYTLIEAGAVTLGDIGDLYRYPNTLELVRISGRELKLWLERSAEGFVAGQSESPFSYINTKIPSYNVDSFYGLEYQIDPTQPIGERITSLRYQGKPIAGEQLILVATNNYRAAGGGDFADLNGSQSIYRSPDEIQKILVDFVRQLPNQNYQPDLIKNWAIEGLSSE